MAEEIDVYAMLLRAEEKAKKRLESADLGLVLRREFEEEYARAIAVRKTWEAFERVASKESQSGSSFKP